MDDYTDRLETLILQLRFYRALGHGEIILESQDIEDICTLIEGYLRGNGGGIG